MLKEINWGSNTTYLNEKCLKIVHSYLLYSGFEALNEAVSTILPLFRSFISKVKSMQNVIKAEIVAC